MFYFVIFVLYNNKGYKKIKGRFSMLNILDKVEKSISTYLVDLIGLATIKERSYFNRKYIIETEYGSLVIEISYNEQLKFICLESIILTQTLLKKGLSLDIITVLANIAKEANLDLYIGVVINDGYRSALARHGGVVIGDTVKINVEKWLKNNQLHNLHFEYFEGEFILVDELEEYKASKSKVVTAVTTLLQSWSGEFDIVKKGDAVKRIMLFQVDEQYVVELRYSAVQQLIRVMDENNFENYIREKRLIGVSLF